MTNLVTNCVENQGNSGKEEGRKLGHYWDDANWQDLCDSFAHSKTLRTKIDFAAAAATDHVAAVMVAAAAAADDREALDWRRHFG